MENALELLNELRAEIKVSQLDGVAFGWNQAMEVCIDLVDKKIRSRSLQITTPNDIKRESVRFGYHS